jgi:hypothetical protein
MTVGPFTYDADSKNQLRRMVVFALVTKVTLPADGTIEAGRKDLETNVIPMIKQAPGFVSCVFLSPAEGNEGLSVIVFETREQAEGAQQMQKIEPPLTLVSNDIREVAASA